MKTLNVIITNKVAVYSQRGGEIVCGNDDYQIKFTFDSEWDAFSAKTARFKWNGAFYDVPFTGNTVTVPRLINTKKLEVGVYAGDVMHTSTGAIIKCVPSSLCGTTVQAPGSDAPYYAMAKAEADRAEEAADTTVERIAEQLLGGIVQGTGDSETQVMSQKAVTDRLHRIAQTDLTAFEPVNILEGLTLTKTVGASWGSSGTIVSNQYTSNYTAINEKIDVSAGRTYIFKQFYGIIRPFYQDGNVGDQVTLTPANGLLADQEWVCPDGVVQIGINFAHTQMSDFTELYRLTPTSEEELTLPLKSE